MPRVGLYTRALAIAADPSGVNLLYATDFKNNKVDVFNKDYQKITVTGGFTDAQVPADYGPFGIQAIPVSGQTRIFVSYAQHVAGSNDNANGAGLGLVNVFDTQGTLVSRLISTGAS